MVTTIQVQEKTLRLLKQAKKRLKLSTYDDVIRRLTERKKPASEVMFGIDREGLTPFSEEDHLDFHEGL